MRIFTLIILMICTSCAGAFLTTGGTTTVPNRRTFAVKPFEDTSNSSPNNLKNDFTSDLITYIIANTKLKYKKKEGDVVYRGVITKYEVIPVGANKDGAALLQRLTMTVEIEYESVWREKPIKLEFTHFVDFPKEELLTEIEPKLIKQLQEEFFRDILNQTEYAW